jgi:hypothetical protein
MAELSVYTLEQMYGRMTKAEGVEVQFRGNPVIQGVADNDYIQAIPVALGRWKFITANNLGVNASVQQINHDLKDNGPLGRRDEIWMYIHLSVSYVRVFRLYYETSIRSWTIVEISSEFYLPYRIMQSLVKRLADHKLKVEAGAADRRAVIEKRRSAGDNTNSLTQLDGDATQPDVWPVEG